MDFGTQWSGLYFVGQPVLRGIDLHIFLPEAMAKGETIVLMTFRGKTARVSMSPELAGRLGLDASSPPPDLAAFRALLNTHEVRLHSPGHIYYATEDLAAVEPERGVALRPLTDTDAALFEAFTEHIDAEELDDAFVELDHWAVYGLFADGVLAAACSLYPWRGTKIADTGVVTRPDLRGRGFGKQLVRYANQRMVEKGYTLQYRTQTDNKLSIALAESLGLTYYAQWQPLAEA